MIGRVALRRATSSKPAFRNAEASPVQAKAEGNGDAPGSIGSLDPAQAWTFVHGWNHDAHCSRTASGSSWADRILMGKGRTGGR